LTEALEMNGTSGSKQDQLADIYRYLLCAVTHDGSVSHFEDSCSSIRHGGRYGTPGISAGHPLDWSEEVSQQVEVMHCELIQRSSRRSLGIHIPAVSVTSV